MKIFRPIIQDNANYTVNLGHVDMNHLKNMKIPFPSKQKVVKKIPKPVCKIESA